MCGHLPACGRGLTPDSKASCPQDPGSPAVSTLSGGGEPAPGRDAPVWDERARDPVSLCPRSGPCAGPRWQVVQVTWSLQIGQLTHPERGYTAGRGWWPVGGLDGVHFSCARSCSRPPAPGGPLRPGHEGHLGFRRHAALSSEGCVQDEAGLHLTGLPQHEHVDRSFWEDHASLTVPSLGGVGWVSSLGPPLSSGSRTQLRSDRHCIRLGCLRAQGSEE